MFNLDKFIADSMIFRPVSMFAADIVVTRADPCHANTDAQEADVSEES